MSIKKEDVEIGKTYLLPNGNSRKVFEIIPHASVRGSDEVSEHDIIRFEAEKWGYDKGQYEGRTRVRIKTRAKMRRGDFAKEASKRVD